MNIMEVYRCGHCNSQVEVTAGNNSIVPVCCGEAMQLQVANTVDAAKEKHVPVVVDFEGKTLVKVGSVAHPMQDVHYIEWIELVCGNRCCRVTLKPGDAPEALFGMPYSADAEVRISCNIHGIWKNN